MSLDMGAMPGTVRTASVVLTIDGLDAGATGLATIALADVRFNEMDAPAVFSLLHLHVARTSDVRVELCAMADPIEEWPRWTARREFTVQVWNLSVATLTARVVPLLLSGYGPAPVPKAARFTRKAALALVDNAGVASAADKNGLPLACRWLEL